jgi:hypothetical protein
MHAMMKRSDSKSVICRAAAMFLVGGLVAAFCWTAAVAVNAAETQYDEISLSRDTEASFRRNDSQVKGILRSKKFENNQEKALVRDYFQKYFFAKWTLQKNIKDLPKFRNELRTSFFQVAETGDTYKELNDLTLEMMRKLAKGNYHPAVRINAVMAIGEMNSSMKTGVTTPEPLPGALLELLSLLENKDMPDSVRVTCMNGIVRHAAFNANMPADVHAKLLEVMVRLATAKPPKNAAADGHYWMLARAMETFGLLGSLGPNNVVFDTLKNTADDAALPLFVRRAAVEAFGGLNYSGAAGLPVADALAAVGRFTLAACDDELAKYAVKNEDPELRHRVLPSLDAATYALGDPKLKRVGMSPVVQGKDQNLHVALQKAIVTARDQLDDKDHEADDMKPVIETLRKTIESLIKK